MDFFKYHTKLDSGEWVSDSDIKSIKQLESGTDYLKMLNEQGVEATNTKIKEDFETTHTQLPSGEWVSNSTIADIERADLENGTNYMEILNTQGITALRDEMNKDNQEYQDFVASHTELANNEWVTNDDWKAIVDADTANGTNYADIAKSQGLDAMKAQLEADTHLLDTGERVSTEDWNSIVSQDTANNTTFASIYQTQGIEAGNQSIQTYKDNATTILNKIPDNYSVVRSGETQYDFLAAYAAGKITKSDLATLGISTNLPAFLENGEHNPYATWDDYIANNVMLAGDDQTYRSWMSKTDFDSLTPEMQAKYMQWGNRVEYLAESRSEIENNTAYSDSVKQTLLNGIDAGYFIPLDEPHRTSLWESITPWNEEHGQTFFNLSWLSEIMPGGRVYYLPEGIENPTWQQIQEYNWDIRASQPSITLTPLITTAMLLVPGVYVATNWNRMSVGEKVLSIGLDVLSVLPIIAAVGKGARSASVVTEVGEMAASGTRLKAAFSAGGKELVSQILWMPELGSTIAGLGTPVKIGEETLTGLKAITYNTKQVLKATGGRVKASLSSIETMVSPTKLPETVVTDAYHSLKIPISKLGTEADAIRAKEQILRAASKPGNYIIVDAGDNIIHLRRSPLMNELGGGLAHATPAGEEFATGFIVNYKKGMPLKEQGLFVSPEPLTRFAGQAAFGSTGKKAVIVIVSPEVAEKAVFNPKIYKRMIEAEGVIDVGTALPKPKQILYTRLGDTGQKVELHLGKALTKSQILKLKAQGLIEQVKNIYKPSIWIESKSGRSLSSSELKVLEEILEDGNAGVARNLRTIASDPRGFVQVWNRLRQPDIYTSYTSVDTLGNVTTRTENFEQRKGESTAAYLTRAKKFINDRALVDGKRLLPDSYRDIDIEDTTRVDAERPELRASTLNREPIVARADTPREYAETHKPSTIKAPTEGDSDEKEREIPNGSIAWKQGMFWKYIPPPWNQQKPITLRNMPKGARAGGRTPAQTVQMIGEPDANVPSSVSVDLGVVDLYITEKGKHIEFSGGGLKTTVGDRLSSSTKGMSVGASASKVRHKSKPKKRKKRDDDWIPVGFRL